MEKEKWTPQSLMQQLKKNVVGQDRYLKDLCSCLWIHYLRKNADEKAGTLHEGPKLNLLVIGKSGTGKTLAVQSLAKLLNLNLVIEDASLFTGAGWKGRETVSIAKDVLLSADQNRKKAEYSVVVLDEIDKIFIDSESKGNFSAVNNFLKLIEGSEIEYTEDNHYYHLNTKNVLFLCLGAFDGLEEIIRRRMKQNEKIGFCSDRQEIPKQNLLSYTKKEDLIAYGMNPQFLGRMAAFTITNELTEEDYYRILTKSESSAIFQYNALLESSMGVSVRITPDAARRLARKAAKEQTNGRSILFEVTNILKDGIYEIPCRPDVKELQIQTDTESELSFKLIKGKRKTILPADRKQPFFPVKKQWAKIPLNLSKYHHSFSGACQCAEDIAEELELHDFLLSQNYSYRRIKAAVCLISCAILFIMAADADETIYHVACTMKMIVKNPPERQDSYQRKDAFAAMYWKSVSYERDIRISVELALHILQEYCRCQSEKGQDSQEVS